MNQAERALYVNIINNDQDFEVPELEARIESSFLNFKHRLAKRKIVKFNIEIRKAERENNLLKVKELMLKKNIFIKQGKPRRGS